MPESRTYRVPMSVSHADFLVALKPLLDLVGVTAMEIKPGIHIDAESITFDLIARGVGDDSEVPTSVVKAESLAESPVEFGELVWPCSVAIDYSVRTGDDV